MVMYHINFKEIYSFKLLVIEQEQKIAILHVYQVP